MKFDWRLTVPEVKRPIWIVRAGDDCDGVAAVRPTYRKVHSVRYRTDANFRTAKIGI
jgi:hypothetical protein